MVVNIHPCDPGLIALEASLYMFTAFTIILVVYEALRNKRVRYTGTYLGGEPEDIVSNPTPSPANLYWGFIKKFAGSLYHALRDRMHTGSLQDWLLFMSSWYGLLLLLSIILTVVYVLEGAGK